MEEFPQPRPIESFPRKLNHTNIVSATASRPADDPPKTYASSYVPRILSKWEARLTNYLPLLAVREILTNLPSREVLNLGRSCPCLIDLTHPTSTCLKGLTKVLFLLP